MRKQDMDVIKICVKLFYYIYSNRMSSFTSSTCWGAIKKHQPL